MDTRPARRLADTIDTVKRLLLFLVGLGTVIVALAGFSNADNGGAVLGLGGLLYGLIAGVSIYVTFGWFEHTLRLLVGLVHNTAGVQPSDGQ